MHVSKLVGLLTLFSFCCLQGAFAVQRKSLVSFQLFEEIDDENEDPKDEARNYAIRGELIVSKLQLNGSLLVSSKAKELDEEELVPHAGKAGAERTYQIDLLLGEPYNQFLTGSANVYSLDLQAKEATNEQIDGDFESGRGNLVKSSFESSFGIVMDSNTTYRWNGSRVFVINRSLFSHPSSGMQASYHLDLEYDFDARQCPQISLQHELVTLPAGLLFFASNVSQECDERNLEPFSKLSRMFINVLVSSEILNPLVNLDLKQVWHFENDGAGWESMNLTHPALDINVVADWQKQPLYKHVKKALFTSKIFEWLPSFALEYSNRPAEAIYFLIKILRDYRPNHDEL